MRTAHPLLWATCFAVCLGMGPGIAAAQTQDTAIATSSASLHGQPRVFVARHPQGSAAGDILALHTARGTEQVLWSAADLLDARRGAEGLGQRLVMTHTAHADDTSISWPALAGALRNARLGAVLNGNLWYVGRGAGPGAVAREAMVYAGANDGMLHGFSAEDGQEKIAYVPRGLLQRLATRAPSEDSFQHYVDGPVFGGDAPIGIDRAMRTLVVAGLGAGGKGFVVLDVTEPQAFALQLASDIALLDHSGSTDLDIGQLFSPPVLEDDAANRARHVVRLNDDRWALVLGNGYFSAAGRPVLLIQYLDGARELVKLSPCADAGACVYAGGNGLAMPRLIDIDGDGRVDLAYAGDLQGHLWKFDLSGRNAASTTGSPWRVAFSGQPFFVARDASGRRQPITTAPHWAPHPQGGVMLALGTGRHVQQGDSADTGPQSLYGLHDDSPMSLRAGALTVQDGTPIHTSHAATARPATLVAQQYGETASVDGIQYHTASTHAVSYAGPDKRRGWWIDLPLAGQRVLHNPRGFEGRKLLVHSVVPAMQTSASVRPWTDGQAHLSVLNILTGHPPLQPAFAPGDAWLLSEPIGMASAPQGPALLFRRPGQLQLRFPNGQDMTLRTGSTVGARAGWHERR